MEPTETPKPVEAPVKYARVKVMLACGIGGLLAFNALPDASKALLGPPWVGPAAAIATGALYGLDKYLQRPGSWNAGSAKADEPPTVGAT